MKTCARRAFALPVRRCCLRPRAPGPATLLFPPASLPTPSQAYACLQVMPPFDPEMVEPLHVHLRSKGCTLHLGDGVAGFERGSGDRGLVVRTQAGKAHPADLVILVSARGA